MSSARRTTQLAFFILNFSGAMVVAIACVLTIVEGFTGTGRPFAFLGALSSLLPAGMFALGEWLAFFRKRNDLEMPLGIACVLIGGFLGFGFAANLYEAWRDGWPGNGFAWVLAAILTIGCYLLVCGIWRIQSRRAAR